MVGIKKPLPVAAGKGFDFSSSSDDSNVFDSRLSRYYTAKKRAQVNRDELLTQASLCVPDTPQFQKYVKASGKIGSCGNYLVFNDYFTVGKTRLAKASFCKQHLICPLCAIRRASKSLQAYLARYQVVMNQNPHYRLSMITLTVKNGNDLQERFEHLRKSQKKMFKHRADFLSRGWGSSEFRKIHGWVGTHEVTNKGKGWHPHSHIMVLHTENFDYSKLIKEWKSVTGDSCNINVTAAKNPDDPAQDFIEVFKYAVKFSDLTPEQNIIAWHELAGKRLLFSGGALRGVQVPEELTDELLDDLDYIERFYIASSVGYSLQAVRHVSAPDPVDTGCSGAKGDIVALRGPNDYLKDKREVTERTPRKATKHNSMPVYDAERVKPIRHFPSEST